MKNGKGVCWGEGGSRMGGGGLTVMRGHGREPLSHFAQKPIICYASL